MNAVIKLHKCIYGCKFLHFLLPTSVPVMPSTMMPNKNCACQREIASCFPCAGEQHSTEE